MSTEKAKSPTPLALPSVKDFCLTVPLYEKFEYDDEKNNGFFSLEQFEGTLDFHCPECGQHSVFTARKNNYYANSHYTNHLFTLQFICSRNTAHQAVFVFRAHKGALEKIGQIPSLAQAARS